MVSDIHAHAPNLSLKEAEHSEINQTSVRMALTTE
jgi:hypothetical protein